MSLELKLLIDRYVGWVLIFFLNIAARILGATLRRDHSLRIKGDILVIKMLGGGSLVMAFPALLGIHKTYPDSKMRLFTTSAVKPFAETLGVFDEILVLDDRSLIGLIRSGFKCVYACFHVDTVIDLEVYSNLSTVLSLLTCARNRLGFFFEETGFRQILHTHRLFFNAASPLYLHYDGMANIVGAPVIEPKACADHMFKVLGVSTSSATPDKKGIAVGCGCSDLSHERKLSPQQWSQYVFGACADKQREATFLGSSGDKTEAEKVIAAVVAAKDAWHGPLKNSCGTMSLRESLKILAECHEFWGIESSLLHYARLFGLRCTAFLGPTHPMRLRPIPGLEEKIHYRKTLCSPCIHLVSVPPCHGNNLCMQWLFEPPNENDPRKNWIPMVMDTARIKFR